MSRVYANTPNTPEAEKSRLTNIEAGIEVKDTSVANQTILTRHIEENKWISRVGPSVTIVVSSTDVPPSPTTKVVMSSSTTSLRRGKGYFTRY